MGYCSYVLCFTSLSNQNLLRSTLLCPQIAKKPFLIEPNRERERWEIPSFGKCTFNGAIHQWLVGHLAAVGPKTALHSLHACGHRVWLEGGPQVVRMLQAKPTAATKFTKPGDRLSAEPPEESIVP